MPYVTLHNTTESLHITAIVYASVFPTWVTVNFTTHIVVIDNPSTFVGLCIIQDILKLSTNLCIIMVLITIVGMVWSQLTYMYILYKLLSYKSI